MYDFAIQGIRLKAGESLVAMAVLPPELVQQVNAVQAAAKEEQDDAAAAGSAAAAEAAAAAAVNSSAEEQQGPWLLLVTRLGTSKRVLLSDVPCKMSRGVQGVIGIKLNAGTVASLGGLREWQLAGLRGWFCQMGAC